MSRREEFEVDCDDCDGTGVQFEAETDEDGEEECPTCDGTGRVTISREEAIDRHDFDDQGDDE